MRGFSSDRPPKKDVYNDMTALGTSFSDVDVAFVPDDELVERTEGGQTEALAELVNRYAGELYPYLLKMTGRPETAEDIFQETFVRIMVKKGKYRSQGNFRAFLFTVARNLVYDMLRKAKVRREVSLDTSWDDEERNTPLEVEERTPLDILTKEEMERVLDEGLDRLPPKTKESLILKRFGGFSYEEIANLVGCSTSAVKMRVSRALSQLAKYMTEYKNGQRSRR